MLDGKKVLITGLTGQIGGAIANAHAPRCEMWGLARYTRGGSREQVEAMGVRPVVCDLARGDFAGVPDDFDYVLHFAATTSPRNADEGMAQNAEATGLLMHHCRKAKAFLHIGATACYTPNPDPNHRFKETDDMGSAFLRGPNYAGTKLAAEGVVRTLARILDLPVTIARINVAYGDYDDGGMPGRHLKALVEGGVITLPIGPCMHSPIHDDDLAAHVEPLLRAASVPATIVNWGGSEGVNVRDWVDYLGELTGLTPKFNFTDERALPSYVTDTTKGREIGREWKVHWKDGMRRMVTRRYPEIPLRQAAG